MRTRFVLFKLPTYLLLALAVWSTCNLESSAQDDSGASPTNWIGAKGNAIEADFVRMGEDTVTLRLRTTGKEVNVPLSSLSLESHLQALKLADPEAFSKPLVQANAKPVIEAFEPTFTVEADDLLKSPYPSNPTVEQFLDTVNAEFERGNIFIAWHSLPPKMQTDIETLLVRILGSVKPAQMVQLRALMKSINTIVVEKRDFIFAQPDILTQPDAVEQLTAEWPKIASLTTSFTDKDNWQTEHFQEGKVIPWLAKMSALLAPYVAEGAKTSLGGSKLIVYNVKSQTSDTAEVEVSSGPLPPQVMKFQKFGNIWIIPDAMNELRSNLDTALAQVGTNFDTAPLSVGLLGANAVAGSLARANTQEEFNDAVEQLKSLVPQQPGAAGGFSPPMSQPSGGKSSPGFGPPSTDR